MTDSLNDSKPTDGAASTALKISEPVENGVEFGLRPRNGVLYLPKFPPPDQSRRMLMKDNLMCKGVDIIDGVRWFRFQVDAPPKQVILLPASVPTKPPYQFKESDYDEDGRFLGAGIEPEIETPWDDDSRTSAYG